MIFDPVLVGKGSVAESTGTPPITPTAASPTVTLKGQSRSAKLDGVDLDITGNKTRDKCIELIYDALSIDSGARTLLCVFIAVKRSNPVFRSK